MDYPALELRVRSTAECESSCQNVTRSMFQNMSSVTLCQFGSRLAGLIALFLMFVFSPMPATAAEADSTSENPLRPGAVGIEFGLNSVFGGGFSGTLSGKWHTGRTTALRVGGGASFRGSEGTGSETFQDQFQTIVSATDTHEEERSYSAFAELMKYLTIDRRIAFFAASGPVFQWNSDSFTQHAYLQTGEANLYHFGSSGWAAGLEISAGVEWFFHNRLSLGARYGISGLYGESNNDHIDANSGPSPSDNTSDVESTHQKNLNIQTESTLMTLTAYF